MNVTIVGGGIGGLVAALAMTRQGIDVVVLEQAPELTEIGAGIQIGANGTIVLGELGLESAVARVGVVPEAWDQIDYETGRLITTTPLGERGAAAHGALLYNVHRADLIALLAAALPPGVLRTGARVVDIGQDAERAWVDLDQGERLVADVVVGADGIRSQLRERLWGVDEMQYAGILMWRSLIPASRLAHIDLPRRGNFWIGPGRTIISYWVRDDLYSVLASVPDDEVTRESWTESGDIDEFHRSFADGEPRVLALLESIDAAFITGMNYRDPLSTWSSGRITLLGDAAHPMVPYLAQGACQAMEDAWALAAMLADGSGDVPAQLVAYETMRRPRTTRMQAGARAMVKSVHEHDGDRIRMRNGRLRGLRRIDPLGETTFGFAWQHDILDAVRRPPAATIGISGVEEGFSLERPESRRAHELWRGFVRPDDAAEGHDGLRAAYDRFLLDTLVEGPTTEAVLLDLDGVPAMEFGGRVPDGPVVLHLHGGGYVVGSAAAARDYASRLASSLRGSAVAVDYRLAPEHPYPAALDDATIAYRALLDSGVAPEHIVVSGESAGAGLALALTMVLRAAGDPLPAGLVAVCPMADLTLSSASIRARMGQDPAAHRDTLAGFAASYFQGHDPCDPLVSPILGDLGGLPPMFVTAATNEALFDDARRWAATATAAHDDVTTLWIDDSVHVYPLFPFLPETGEFLTAVASWWSRRTGRRVVDSAVTGADRAI